MPVLPTVPPEPCAGPCPFPACLNACSVWLAQPDPCVESGTGTAGSEWWCLGARHPQLSAPTPCHRAAAGPSRWNPLPGVTHGGCWVLRAPPVPSLRPGWGERRYRRYQPPAGAGPWAAGADLALAGQRAGPYLHVPAPATPLL